MEGYDSIQSATIVKFKEPRFAVNFAIDNNPLGVIAQLKKMGYSHLFTQSLAFNKIQARNLILTWYKNKNTREILNLLNNVDYLRSGSYTAKYTEGFRDYFLENTPTADVSERQYRNVETEGQKFSFDGLLAGLGAGLTTYGAFASMGTGVNSNGLTFDEQKELDDAKKKKQTWTIIGVVIGLLVVTAIVILVMKEQKKGK